MLTVQGIAVLTGIQKNPAFLEEPDSVGVTGASFGSRYFFIRPEQKSHQDDGL